MSVILPDPRGIDRDPRANGASQHVIDFLLRLNEALSNELERRVESRRAVDSVYLTSPSGKVFQVSVDDAGVVSATLKYSP